MRGRPTLSAAIADLGRLSEIARVATRYGFGALLSSVGAGRERRGGVAGAEEGAEAEAAPQLGGVPPARRFALFLQELGPTFIKLGQVLSTRPDIIPPAFVNELRTLQDDVPPFPFAAVRERLAEELGRPVEELFEEIDAQPIASASIAQVHRARLKGGEEVAVKVQRPGIERTIGSDMGLLHVVARMLEAIIEESGVYAPVGIVEEFDRALHQELDFRNEARNLKRFFEDARELSCVVVPRLFEGLSGQRVLTMEFVRGTPLNQVIERGEASGHDRKHIARNLMDIAFAQAFTHGFFHADPHPGNLLVLDDERIVLLDFGLAGGLTPAMQETIVLLCLAAALQDAETAARLLYRVGVPDERVNLAAFQAEIRDIFDRYLSGRRLGEISSTALMQELLDLTMNYGIRVPRQYALISKAAVTLDGVVRSLHPEMDLLEEVLPYARRLLKERYDPRNMSGGFMRVALQLGATVQDLPRQLSQILFDMEAGKLSVRVQLAEVSRLAASIRLAAITLFAAIIAGAFILGAFQVMAAQVRADLRGFPIAALVGLLAGGVIIGGALGWFLVSGRIGKIRLRRWLGWLRRSE